MSIQLPQEPKGKDYEDLLTACLLGMGYWVETNLHLRDETTEILELDILGTPIDNPLNPILLEAKSGKAAGFADVFKVAGWIKYVGVPRGCLVRTKPLDDQKKAAIEKVSNATNVLVATVAPPHINLDFLGVAITPPEELQQSFAGTAWYGRIGQRLCLASFEHFAKSESSNLQSLADAKSYRWTIEQSFFVPQPIQRASSIYKAYQNCPGVTGHVITEMTGSDEEKYKAYRSQVWDTSERQYLQYILLLENIARIAVVKNALLHILHREQQGEVDGIDWNELLESTMPESFQEGLAHLKNDPHRNRIPFLYQIFIEVFGGWYSIRNTDDLQLLSNLTGIPVDRIEPSLMYLNEIFPTKNGWFVDYKNELRVMKMVPAVCRGTGAFLRNAVYQPGEYSNLYPSMGFLVTKWHNALYGILKKYLQVNDAK